MNEIQANELAGAVLRASDPRCPCGVLKSMAAMWHPKQQNHECLHHPRRQCGWCKSVDRLIAGVEARLYVEAEHGPFIVM